MASEPPIGDEIPPPPPSYPGDYPGGPAPAPQNTGLQPNVASLLCYLFGWVGGLIFLLVEKNSKVVKFNAIQSIAMTVVWVAAYIVVIIIGLVIGLLGTLLSLLLFLGGLGLWIYMMVTAYQGKLVRLPIIGDFCAQQAGI